jgi:transcriptional regulator with XRE-family HTH domain
MPETSLDRVTLGERLRALRQQRGWTLAQLAGRSGLALSTISKVERGRMSLAYDKFMQLAHGLGVDVGDLFGAPEQGFDKGGVTVTRAGQAEHHETAEYVYDMLCTELRGKRMVPMLGRIKAHDVRQFSDIVKHPGEEFVFVLTGELSVHLEDREPILLRPHDSIYFDSAMKHAYVSAGAEDATIVVVCWQPGGGG